MCRWTFWASAFFSGVGRGPASQGVARLRPRIEGWLVSMLAWQGLAGHLLAHRMVSVEPVTVLGRPIDAPVQRSADDE